MSPAAAVSQRNARHRNPCELERLESAARAPLCVPMIVLSDRHIQRTALALMRSYGARARAEAWVWCRHFAQVGDQAERIVWTRVLLELRRLHQTGAALAVAA